MIHSILFLKFSAVGFALHFHTYTLDAVTRLDSGLEIPVSCGCWLGALFPFGSWQNNFSLLPSIGSLERIRIVGLSFWLLECDLHFCLLRWNECICPLVKGGQVQG